MSDGQVQKAPSTTENWLLEQDFPRSCLPEGEATAHGPFDDLIAQDSKTVRKRLGPPTAIESEHGIAEWRYDQLGLTLFMTVQVKTGTEFVLTMVQRCGRVTGDVVIGEIIPKSAVGSEQVDTGVHGKSSIKVDSGNAVITIALQDGIVVEAQIDPKPGLNSP